MGTVAERISWEKSIVGAPPLIGIFALLLQQRRPCPLLRGPMLTIIAVSLAVRALLCSSVVGVVIRTACRWDNDTHPLQCPRVYVGLPLPHFAPMRRSLPEGKSIEPANHKRLLPFFVREPRLPASDIVAGTCLRSQQGDPIRRLKDIGGVGVSARGCHQCNSESRLIVVVLSIAFCDSSPLSTHRVVVFGCRFLRGPTQSARLGPWSVLERTNWTEPFVLVRSETVGEDVHALFVS
mmetsp:Transcript_47637/g.95998  ORF Transcript_47637/g.95998 Transcript_47637/m.95998 type:complete len:237 (+) Transcript_47637:132-842(+)